jgi:hypothetical protein
MIFKDLMGALAVLIALFAYGIYAWQTLRGEARPHPLSWLIFAILTGTGYLVQLDQAAGPASWVMAITTVICLLLCLTSFWQGERTFPWYEWAFLLAAAIVFAFYLWSGRPTVSAVLAAAVMVLGFGPTVTKAWTRPHSDSVTTFALNGLKFVPSFFALDTVSLATWLFPATLVATNLAVALIIYARRKSSSVAIAGGRIARYQPSCPSWQGGPDA